MHCHRMDLPSHFPPNLDLNVMAEMVDGAQSKAGTEEAGAAMCNEWANEALLAFERLLDIFVYQGSEALQDHNGAR